MSNETPTKTLDEVIEEALADTLEWGRKFGVDYGAAVTPNEAWRSWAGLAHWQEKIRAAAGATPVSLPEGLDICDLFDALFVADKDFKTAPDHSPEEDEAYERRRVLMRKIVEAARAPLGEAPKPEALDEEMEVRGRPIPEAARIKLEEAQNAIGDISRGQDLPNASALKVWDCIVMAKAFLGEPPAPLVKGGVVETAPDDGTEGGKYVYCHSCSEAGGAERGIYHLAPACPGKLVVEPGKGGDQP